jgi:hypothetical protein
MKPVAPIYTEGHLQAPFAACRLASPQARRTGAEAGTFNNFDQALGLRQRGVVLDIRHFRGRIDVDIDHSRRTGKGTLDDEYTASTTAQTING